MDSINFELEVQKLLKIKTMDKLRNEIDNEKKRIDNLSFTRLDTEISCLQRELSKLKLKENEFNSILQQKQNIIDKLKNEITEKEISFNLQNKEYITLLKNIEELINQNDRIDIQINNLQQCKEKKNNEYLQIVKINEEKNKVYNIKKNEINDILDNLKQKVESMNTNSIEQKILINTFLNSFNNVNVNFNIDMHIMLLNTKIQDIKQLLFENTDNYLKCKESLDYYLKDISQTERFYELCHSFFCNHYNISRAGCEKCNIKHIMEFKNNNNSFSVEKRQALYDYLDYYILKNLNNNFYNIIKNYILINEFDDIVKNVSYTEFIKIISNYDFINKIIKNYNHIEKLMFILFLISKCKMIVFPTTGAKPVYNYFNNITNREKYKFSIFENNYVFRLTGKYMTSRLYPTLDNEKETIIMNKLDEIKKYNLYCFNFETIDFNKKELITDIEFFQKKYREYDNITNKILNLDSKIKNYTSGSDIIIKKKELNTLIETNYSNIESLINIIYDKYNTILDKIISFKKLINY